ARVWSQNAQEIEPPRIHRLSCSRRELPMTSRISRLILVMSVLMSTLEAQQSAALFDAPVIVGTDYTRLLNVLDFDGDGWKDAISCWYQPGTSSTAILIHGWRNDQTGHLVIPWSLSHPLVTFTLLDVDMATGDMNLYGRDDFGR